MRGAGLKGFVVLHERFAAVGPDRSGELLRLGLLPRDDRHRHPALGKVGIDVEHSPRFVAGFIFGCVDRVTLLPKKLGRP